MCLCHIIVPEVSTVKKVHANLVLASGLHYVRLPHMSYSCLELSGGGLEIKRDQKDYFSLLNQS